MCDFKSVVDVAPRKFVEDMLIKTLKAKKLCCGFNYTFGKNGEGNTELLAEICKENGIELQVLPPVEEKEGVVSSTLIRELIKDGNVRRANELLGSYFGFGGEVVHGQHLGRELGTPTLNQSLHEELVVPKFGVYASCVTLDDGRKFCGVTNIGVKPTVGEFAPLCETWMPDYSGEELYGKTVDVRLIDFIRGEKKFSSLDELKKLSLTMQRQPRKCFLKLIIYNNQPDNRFECCQAFMFMVLFKCWGNNNKLRFGGVSVGH